MLLEPPFDIKCMIKIIVFLCIMQAGVTHNPGIFEIFESKGYNYMYTVWDVKLVYESLNQCFFSLQ